MGGVRWEPILRIAAGIITSWGRAASRALNGETLFKVAVIFGTRPEAIKMAPVIRALKAEPGEFRTLVWVTAQHRELLDQVLDFFEVTPDRDFGIMRPGQDVFDVTVSVLNGLKDVLLKDAPDLVLVHGDTTTAMAAGVAAFYRKVRVGHVEAGLRTGDKHNPFPEEMNRRIVGALADIHFAPTASARDNLLSEGVREGSVHVTGNTSIDALLTAMEKLGIPAGGLIARPGRRKVLVTAHRRESFGRGLENICLALKDLALKYPGLDIVFPVHPNPNVRMPVTEMLSGIGNVALTDPLEYLQFIRLMSESYMVLTDSGGVQEEAPSLGKPVLVLREVTERPEAVEAGTVMVVGTKRRGIVDAASRLLDDEGLYRSMSMAHNPYGDGFAARRIVDAVRGLRDSLRA